MKEQIYTIPVNDAFAEGGECPFCNMYHKLEEDAIEYQLGPSYMEADIREETDKIGFCSKHWSEMYKRQNRLGVALMLHTHIKKINKDLTPLIETNNTTKKKGLFSKQEENPLCGYLNKITSSCYTCNRIAGTFDRYIDTFFYMWTKKPEIKESVKKCSGFCIEHFSLLMQTGEKKLSTKDYIEFKEIISSIQLKNMKRLEEEVEWFINKFDYKYADQPWKTAKDALPRGLEKISSIKVEEQ